MVSTEYTSCFAKCAALYLSDRDPVFQRAIDLVAEHVGDLSCTQYLRVTFTHVNAADEISTCVKMERD